jgi:hypothetical protein
MNKLKPLVVSLLLLGGGLGAESVSAKKPPQAPPAPDMRFAGVGIGQSQVLGLFLSNPAAPTATSGKKPSLPPTPKNCNAVAQVVGIDGTPVLVGLDGNTVVNTANLLTLDRGETTFIAIPKPSTGSGVMPQYYSVSVRNVGGCLGLEATLGVYNTNGTDQVPQDLQLVVQMLPPMKDSGSPLDQPPVDQPPVDQPPVDCKPEKKSCKPPVDQPPVDCKPEKKSCKPPVDQPPVDQPPVDQPPVDQPPVDQPPVDQPPTTPGS